MSLAPAIVLAPAPIVRRIVVPRRRALVMGERVMRQAATVLALIGVRPIALAQRDGAPTATNRDVMCQTGTVASAPDQPVRRQFFRRSLARVCV